MRLGIGGSVFGIRGGISTRGIGVGLGPLSAGTSWRGSRGGSGSIGLLAWILGGALIFFAAAWPYLLGTFLAVRSGAENPSTARFVTGWCLEVIYVAGLLAWFLIARERKAHQAVLEDQRMTSLIASGVVYEAQHGRSAVYRHGTCAVNHKTFDTATNCRKSAPPSNPFPNGPPVIPPPSNRSAALFAGVLLGVGLVAGLVILLVDPIHKIPSPAEQARAKPCSASTSIDGTRSATTMPDFIGQNAEAVETRLKGMGLNNVTLSSANPKYKSVWVASNWTVFSTDPAPGCSINSSTSLIVYVTKG